MMTGFDMGFGGIWMILFWVVIIGLAVWLLGNLFPRTTSAPPAQRSSNEVSESPLEILKQRYARGELSKEEYETIRHDLEQ